MEDFCNILVSGFLEVLLIKTIKILLYHSYIKKLYHFLLFSCVVVDLYESEVPLEITPSSDVL